MVMWLRGEVDVGGGWLMAWHEIRDYSPQFASR